MNHPPLFDVFVIGGGINGVGIASDCAGRGMSVLLCEQGDLGGATSSASSKLIHGGLRYLEHLDFSLVRESLKERQVLLQTAPHLVKSLRFAVPIKDTIRPFWLIRLGLFLYDLMGFSRDIKRSKTIQFQAEPTNPLKLSIRKGFIYSDCMVDDARLVIANAQQAFAHGATILTRTQCLNATRGDEYWEVTLQDNHTQERKQIRAKALVNATGPWINQTLINTLKIPSRYQAHLIKGSHLVVPKLHDREQAYVLQHKDGRVVFVIPYLNQFSLIGTTDVPFKGEPVNVHVEQSEIDYLCTLVSQYFHHPLKAEHIVHSWSGVRSCIDETSASPAQISRGYKLECLTVDKKRLPLINIFGGKITTYRFVSEQVGNSLSAFFPDAKKAWTKEAPLPGGDLPNQDLSLFIEKLSQDYPWLPSILAIRYSHSYGTLAYRLLNNINSIQELGADLGMGLYEKEVRYLIDHEWAQTAEDILWRRTKLGLLFSDEQKKALETYLESNI